MNKLFYVKVNGTNIAVPRWRTADIGWAIGEKMKRSKRQPALFKRERLAARSLRCIRIHLTFIAFVLCSFQDHLVMWKIIGHGIIITYLQHGPSRLIPNKQLI